MAARSLLAGKEGFVGGDGAAPNVGRCSVLQVRPSPQRGRGRDCDERLAERRLCRDQTNQLTRVITDGAGVVARIGGAFARSALRTATHARPRSSTRRLPRCGVRRRRR